MKQKIHSEYLKNMNAYLKSIETPIEKEKVRMEKIKRRNEACIAIVIWLMAIVLYIYNYF